ncbi:hypothetical protein [Conexibacter sp. S30A1]|uniref:hypothetical protein n=1 Tax=Conexibacter sp. S30A1 TaxID=2937800 RepID=UPI00200C5AB0|nr:hypothetical protein [Conexibacter sp. S30A1]
MLVAVNARIVVMTGRVAVVVRNLRVLAAAVPPAVMLLITMLVAAFAGAAGV